MLGNYSRRPVYDPAIRNPGGPLYLRTRHSLIFGEGGQPQIPTEPRLSVSEIMDYGARVLLSPSGQSYNLTRLLGVGTFGQTFGAEQPLTDGQFAIKVVRYTTNVEIRNAKKEVDALVRVRDYQSHESHLLTFVDCFQHEQEYCIVTELLDINLGQYIEWKQHQPTPLEDVRQIAKQVLLGLAELHGMGLAHCDLKPQNIMFVNYRQHGFRLKLIDLGNVNEKYELRGRQGQPMQTPTYRAPEIFIGLPVNETMDQWSIGVTLIELYAGERFMYGVSDVSMMSLIERVVGLPFECCDGLYFDKYGTFDVPQRKPVLHEFVTLAQESWYTEYGLRNLHKYGNNVRRNGFASQDDRFFEMFLEKLMNCEPSRRPSATDLLQDPFLKSQKERDMIDIRHIV